jgi:hypothetical protein
MHSNCRDPLVRSGIALVLVHAATVLVHGISHAHLGIGTAPWQTLFIVVVIVVAPLVSAALLRRAPAAGFGLLTGALFGSLVFGLAYHFLVEGPDNVASLQHGAWAAAFETSAWLLMLTEAAGTIVGVVGLGRAVETRRLRAGAAAG